MSWREQIAPIIAAALDEGRAKGLEGKALEKHVRGSRPHWCRGTEGYWPIKVWRNEFNAQVKGVKKPMGRRKANPKTSVLKGQGELFGSDA